MKQLALKQKAQHLRRKGWSYTEISRELLIAKSTCSVWLKGVRLGTKAKQRLQKQKHLSLLKGQKTVHTKKARQLEEAQIQADQALRAVSLNQPLLKLLCAIMYWGEGEKSGKRIAFTNSDPVQIQFFLRLLRRGFTIQEEKLSAILHLHSYHNIDTQKRFWSKLTGIPIGKISIYQKNNSGKNQRLGYPGCISIRYHDSALFQQITQIYTLAALQSGRVG